jgi:branched-chain amino acid transport system substrate-binding protein
MSPTKLLLACAAAALLSIPAASARPAAGTTTSADPGITAKTILLGGTSPLSGPASAYASVARGADAYFKYVNARGGVNGRAIQYKYVDDAYNPAQTVQATRQLVEQDKVFAIFNSLGTEQNVATRDYLNQVKVPQLFVASGATTFGRDFKQYPYTIGLQPSYQAEGWIYGKYLARTRPASKIAVLFQNDDYGKDLLNGLKRGIARSKVRVIAAQGFEVTATDVQSQVAKLKASGANTLALFATPKFAIQGYVYANRLGWRPLIINNAVSSASNIMTLASEGGTNKAVENSLSIAFLKDPTDAKWRTDGAIKLYRSVLARYARGANAKDVYHVYGMAAAYETVKVLKAAGKTPTRAAVVAQMRQLNDASNPFLLPGIAIKTSATERFPIEQALLQRWSKGGWRSFGGLWGFRAG